MKRQRPAEGKNSSKLSHLLYLLNNIKDQDKVTPTLISSLERLLDTESTMTDLLTTNATCKSIAFMSNAALSAMLSVCYAFITGQRNDFNGFSSLRTHSTSQQQQVIQLSSPNTITKRYCSNSLSLLTFVQNIFILRYKIDNHIIQKDVFELWKQSRSLNNISIRSGNLLYLSCKNQEWIPRMTFMLAYSCLVNRIAHFKKIHEQSPKDVLYHMKHDLLSQTALRLLFLSTNIAGNMDDQKQRRQYSASPSTPILQVFEPYHIHVNDFVNAIMDLSSSENAPSANIPLYSEGTRSSESAFQSLLREIESYHEWEHDIEILMLDNTPIQELNDRQERPPSHDVDEMFHPHKCIQPEYEKDAIELLPTLDQMSTSAKEISAIVSSMADILHRAATLDGAGGIVRVAKLFSKGENPRIYPDEMLSSLCKACVTEEISAARVSVIMESFLLPSVRNIGKDDPSRPPSRVLMSILSSLINSRQSETISTVFVQILNPQDHNQTNQERLIPNHLQIEFFTRIIKSIQISSENALILVNALNSIDWTEPPMVLLTTVLQSMPNDALSKDTQDTMIEKIILLSADNLYIKSTKFASLIQIFVKRYGGSLESAQVNRLQEACMNLKSITGKAVVTALRKLA